MPVQSAFLAYALGGTDKYGGNANMTSAHERLVKQYGLRMEHFDMILGHLGGALQDLNVPEVRSQYIWISFLKRVAAERMELMHLG